MTETIEKQILPTGEVYLCGPMTSANDSGDFNYPTFHKTAKLIRVLAPEVTSVFNPATTFDGDTTRPWQDYMRIDLAIIMQSDALVCLPGWETSAGGTIEVLTALAIGIPVFGFTEDHSELRMLYSREDGRPCAVEVLAGKVRTITSDLSAVAVS